MRQVRKASERGHANHGWLDSHHTFSFANYYDPKFMGFRVLRVINDDRVAAGRGFGTHPHKDMEIISYVLEGALSHKDSMGTGSTIRPGDVQRMSAGTGVTHSEQNANGDEPVHFLQIWIMPDEPGHKPGYAQKTFPAEEKRDRLKLVASRDGVGGSVSLNQDIRLYATLLSPGATIEHRLPIGRHAWIQVASGSIDVDGQTLDAGDGLAVSDDPMLHLTGKVDAEVLLFDLP